MKRRGFLQMIGAAAVTPALPSVAVGGSAPYTAALAHAKTRVSISAFGMAQALGIPMGQADSLMVELANRGAIATIQGGQGRWAMSRAYVPVLPRGVRAHATCASRNIAKDHASTPRRDPLFAYLHRLCREMGHRLHPSCPLQRFST